jgi:anti-sigma factor RsiW
MEKIMKTDRHETFRRIIDKTLAGEVSLQEEQSLREHLQSCAPCQKYLSAETRVIASLNGFSFDVDPGLQTKVCVALQLRAQQLEARQPSRQRLLWSCFLALLLTVVGSFIELQFGKLAAPIFGVKPMLMRQGLLSFWIAPSLWLLLLLPILPMLLALDTKRKESVQ